MKGLQSTEIPFAGRDHHPHGLDPAEQDKIVRFFKEGWQASGGNGGNLAKNYPDLEPMPKPKSFLDGTDGNAVVTDRDAFGRLRFKTVAGGTYSLIAK